MRVGVAVGGGAGVSVGLGVAVKVGVIANVGATPWATAVGAGAVWHATTPAMINIPITPIGFIRSIR
jgi:hypothetical protein